MLARRLRVHGAFDSYAKGQPLASHLARCFRHASAAVAVERRPLQPLRHIFNLQQLGLY